MATVLIASIINTAQTNMTLISPTAFGFTFASIPELLVWSGLWIMMVVPNCTIMSFESFISLVVLLSDIVYTAWTMTLYGCQCRIHPYDSYREFTIIVLCFNIFFGVYMSIIKINNFFTESKTKVVADNFSLANPRLRHTHFSSNSG